MNATANLRRPMAACAAAAVALSILVVSCTDDGGSDGAATTTEATTTEATTTEATSSTVPDEPGAVRVAVVSDSEVTPEIVELLGASPKVEVVSSVTEPGWRIQELDAALDEAIASEPDVIVYSAGANDLAPLGADGMLEALRPRLERIGETSCAVYPVPSVDTSSMEAAEAEQVQNILAGFETVLGEWGTTFVSYPSIAADLEAEGTRFYAEGGLGSFHPGPAAFQPIAQELTAAVVGCEQ